MTRRGSRTRPGPDSPPEDPTKVSWIPWGLSTTSDAWLHACSFVEHDAHQGKAIAGGGSQRPQVPRAHRITEWVADRRRGGQPRSRRARTHAHRFSDGLVRWKSRMESAGDPCPRPRI